MAPRREYTDAMREWHREYYRRNRELRAKQSLEYDRRNSVYIAALSRKRRARTKQLVHTPRTGKWSAAEDSVVGRGDLSLVEKSVILQRSWSAVVKRQSALRRGGIRCDNCHAVFFSVDPLATSCSKKCSGHRRAYLNPTTCSECKSIFQPRNSGQKYCSNKCRTDNLQAHLKLLICVGCSCEFKQQRSNQLRYCSIGCYNTSRRKVSS